MCAMARPRKPLLSTDRIVETARALVDAEGLAALSTRRLAAELGVSGPSLYNHFRTKDEILEAVADSVSAHDPADYPHLGQAHLLAEQQEKIDERAFETGLRALLDGLAQQYEQVGPTA